VSASQPRHPFTIAWETWQTWSDAEVMRTARRRTAARGESLAVFDQHPEWTKGPGPLAALAANREVVEQLVGWCWSAMREAREQGHGWAEIGAALGVLAAQARQVYLERVQQQQRVHEARPDLGHLLGYDPRWAELARPQRRRPRRPAAGGRRAGGRAVTAGPSVRSCLRQRRPVAGHRPDSEGV
jgi:hypothetical protein